MTSLRPPLRASHLPLCPHFSPTLHPASHTPCSKREAGVPSGSTSDQLSGKLSGLQEGVVILFLIVNNFHICRLLYSYLYIHTCTHKHTHRVSLHPTNLRPGRKSQASSVGMQPSERAEVQSLHIVPAPARSWDHSCGASVFVLSGCYDTILWAVGELINRDIHLSQFGGWKFKIKGPADSVSGEILLPGP